MGELSDFVVGQTVEIQDGRTATVQFVGTTEFAAGDWVGIELEDASGKNDGSVKGQRYFTCEPGYGMFVRPSAASVLEQPTPRPQEKMQSRANGTAAKGRPPGTVAGGLRRQSVLDPAASKRQSINSGSPTPRTRDTEGPRGTGEARLASPSKSPTKQSSSRPLSGNVSSISNPLITTKSSVPAVKSSRLSMAPPAKPSSRASRPSIAGTMNGSAKLNSNGSGSDNRVPAARMSMRPKAHDRLSLVGGGSQASGTSGRASPPDSLDQELLSPTSQVAESETKGPLSPSISASSALSPADSSAQATSTRGRSPPKPANRAPSANTREAEDLRTKIRVLEKKRQEDREKLKALEKVQGERDKFEAIIQKLQSKYQPQQQEIADLKKRLQDEESKVRAMEIQQAENDTVVEVATLDREMAEETAESLRTEFDALRQKHQEMELEVEILREENQELGKEMSPEDKTSQGWIQMERSNERLREALMRLREVTQQQESDLRAQVEELQGDLHDLAGIKEECLHTKESLAQSEAITGDLRQQLEIALGAEEMIEELAEKNLTLSQRVEKLETDIEELENLKEISDEIEMNHTETEKQMQDEIDYQESALVEQKGKSARQDESIQELEYVITQYKDLVANMQIDLQDMRASQQINDAEASELNDRSKAMLDLNMKLQVSASKAQTRVIDLELGKMEAQEAVEHLSIIQRFLPEAFGSKRNSVLAFLRFRRIGFKANLMHGLTKERLNGSSPATPVDIFACCELLEKLTWISCMCNRFIGFINICSLESFEKIAGALHDLEPVERAISGSIDSLKRDDLKEKHCAENLQRSIALMDHLAEVHITEGLEQHADEIQMRASMLHSHLESASTALTQVKAISQLENMPSHDDADDEDDEAQMVLRKIDDLISQIRSAKVVSSKAIRQLEELKSRSLTLDQTTSPAIEQTQLSVSEISGSIRATGISVTKLLNEEGRTIPLTFSEINSAVLSDGTPFSRLTSTATRAAAQLQTFYGMTSSLTQTVEIPTSPSPPPWQLLAQKLRDEVAASMAHEAEFVQIKKDVQDRNAALAMRDKIVEEMTVKVEVLEKRAGESGGRREQVRELETALQAARAKEKDAASTLMELRKELRSLEDERQKWKKDSRTLTATVVKSAQATGADLPLSALTTAHIELLKSQISTLESTIRYLRRAVHAHHIDLSLAFLREPLIQPQGPVESLLQTEARDVLKEMLHHVTQPENQLSKLKVPPQNERLKWRPAKETASWQASRLTEEWEGWREWKDDLAERARNKAKPSQEPNSEKRPKDVLAKLQVNVPHIEGALKGITKEVRILSPGEWEDIESIVGVEGA